MAKPSALRNRTMQLTTAQCLRERKKRVIDLWAEMVRAELPATDGKSHYMLVDSIPQFLDELVNSLSIEHPKLFVSRSLAVTHATHRSAIGDYTLRQVLLEYYLLNRAIFSILDESCVITTHERNLILDHIQHGRGAAAEEYTRLVLEKERHEANVIRQHEREFRTLANLIPQHVWVADSSGQATWFNERFYEFTGKKPHEVLGSGWIQLIHPDDAGWIRERIRETVKAGSSWEGSYRVRGRRGEWRHFLSRGTPIPDDEGKISQWFGTNTDISEQKNTEEALRISEEKFRHLINTIPSMAWITEPDGTFSFQNERFYQYTGETPAILSINTWGKYIHPDDSERMLKVWTHHLKMQEPFRTEIRLKRASDGSFRWHLIQGVPIKSEKDQVIKWFGLNFDIEDQKRALGQLEEERTIREHFISMLSHDLRNPLSAAKTGAELIARNPERIDRIPKLAARAIEGLERADHMIQDLLDISRIRAGKDMIARVEKGDLVTVFREVWEEFSTTYGNRFDFSLPESMWGVWSKEDLRRVLENLLTNAIKYGDSDRRISVLLKAEEGQCVFSVHNFGTPIPVQDHANLFEPFVRSRPKERGRTRGWGIGLALVKYVVDAHEGSIHIESSAESGTSFTVKLPIRVSR